jgi:hypothetical protein
MNKEKYFDIRNKQHRLLSVAYGNMRYNIRSKKYRDEDPAITAGRVINLANEIPGGDLILVDIAESGRNPSLHRPVELKRPSSEQVLRAGEARPVLAGTSR